MGSSVSTSLTCEMRQGGLAGEAAPQRGRQQLLSQPYAVAATASVWTIRRATGACFMPKTKRSTPTRFTSRS
jgi:hypothetical protein